MNMNSDMASRPAQFSLRALAAFSMIFFLVVVFLTAFVFVPNINKTVESQNNKDVKLDMAREITLFSNYIEAQVTNLQDLAQFPSIVNAVMLSESSSPALLDLVGNVVINGERGLLVLQDIAGTVLIQSGPGLQGNYGGSTPWIENILGEQVPYHFQLLKQNGEKITFKLSVAVKFNNFPEGVLSAEITTPFHQIFPDLAQNKRIAYKLVQDPISVSTDSSQIEMIREHSQILESPNLNFIYITDDSLLRQEATSIKTRVLLILLGALVLSFLLSALYGYYVHIRQQSQDDTKHTHERNYTLPIVVAAIGTLASAIVFYIFHNIQQDSVRAEHTAFGSAHARTIEARLKSNLDILNSASALFYASEFVSREEFDEFSTMVIETYPNIYALLWVPYVPYSERNKHEAKAASDGLLDYEIKEIGIDNKLQPIGEKDHYFPLFYVSPIKGNEKVLGFDMASNNIRHEALLKANNGGNQIATAPINLVEENTSVPGILVFDPVFRKANTSANSINAENPYENLRGFVQLVLKTEDVLSQSIQQNNIILSTHVQDITDSSNPQTLYGEPLSDEQISHSQSIVIAGRAWKIDTSTTELGDNLLWIPWAVFICGLVITALLSTIMAYLINRRLVVEALVKERTAEIQMLSSIVENSNDMFVVTGASQNDIKNLSMPILYANKSFTTFTGYSQEECVGATPKITYGENIDHEQLEVIKNCLSHGEEYSGEVLRCKKDKSEYWADINMIPIKDDNGTVVQFATIQRDITERIVYQKERQKFIDKLTDSNEELTRFAYVCSHDLQGPLRMIRSFSEKLQSHLGDELADNNKARKYFDYVIDGATRAQELIADILVYSRIDSDTQKAEVSDGNDLIQNIIDSMQQALDECGGRITHDTIPQLQGNKTQFFQLFQNLINNAIKYRKPDVAPTVHISVADSGNLWQFSVKDNGIGMEQRHQHKIFDVFQRLHRRSSYAGTGIGLSICKKVVERHGGKIWVESVPDVGSTFHFTIAKSSNEDTHYGQQYQVG